MGGYTTRNLDIYEFKEKKGVDMDLDIKGKRVLVTGASQGIGREIALSFAKEDCKVSIVARREDKLKELACLMGGKDKGHFYHACDLMQEGEPKKAIDSLAAKGGAFEIVIHNVGGTLGLKDPLSPLADWYKAWYFNVAIAIKINSLVIPYMQKKKWGRIIHISSVSAEDVRGSAPYAASKAYLNAYAKGIGRAFARDGIIITAIMPGAVYASGGHWDEDSSINIDKKEEFIRKREDFIRHHHAIGRLGTASEIAPFVLFMASKHVTFAPACALRVDGGTM